MKKNIYFIGGIIFLLMVGLFVWRAIPKSTVKNPDIDDILTT